MEIDKREVDVLRRAAMSLLCMLSGNHSVECTCEHCKNACDAVFYLPKLRQSHAQEWERRTAVQKVHEKQALNINPNFNPNGDPTKN